MPAARPPGDDALMQSSLLADDDLPDAASLVATLTHRGSAGAYGEWHGGGSAPAPHWQSFFNSLGMFGWADLAARHQRVRHRVREDGATYNVYAGGEGARPWPLELLPFIDRKAHV
jgi:uncharacterized circularly permuted ATP-grasp superfamily protein